MSDEIRCRHCGTPIDLYNVYDKDGLWDDEEWYHDETYEGPIHDAEPDFD